MHCFSTHKNSLVFLIPMFFGLFFSVSVTGQERGGKPIAKKESERSVPEFSTTRALVVGISDYADERIDDLRFAHVDAAEMVNFLKSVGGGEIDEENIQFLSDEKATVAQIYSSLDWLLEVSQPTDKVIIYFAGHGDVETKMRRQKGFFLAHDTPRTNYRIGALRVEDLNDYLETMALENRSKVVVITDACRSGHLAGGSEGARTTAENMAELLENEIKIMSCSPDEFSLEGRQWGGGRGVFSYYLLDGFGGLADANADGAVDLSEIDAYLKSNVVMETDSSQIPNSVGLPETQLFDVDADFAAELKTQRNPKSVSGTLVIRGGTAAVLEKVDRSVRQIYEEFLAALKSGYLLRADADSTRIADKSADELYSILIEKPALNPLFFTLKQNFAVALQDDAQRALNAYLAADPEELEERWTNFGAGYKKYPSYLERAAELLGESHVLYPQLLAKKLYFDGLILRLDGQQSGVDSLFSEALKKEEAALKLDTNAAYIFNELGLIYDELRKIEKRKGDAEKVAKFDSLQIRMYREAMEIAPEWVMPYHNISVVYYVRDELPEAETAVRKALRFRPEFARAYYNLGTILQWSKRDSAAIEAYQQAIELDSVFTKAHYFLGEIFQKQGKDSVAINAFQKAIASDSNFVRAYDALGYLYIISGDYESAEGIYLKLTKLDPTSFESFYNLACIYAGRNDLPSALSRLEEAIKKGATLETINSDPDLKKVRSLPEFEVLKKRYFSKEKN